LPQAGHFSTTVDLKNYSLVKHKSVIEARHPRLRQYLVPVAQLPFKKTKSQKNKSAGV
jgi:hypothetical protein